MPGQKRYLLAGMKSAPVKGKPLFGKADKTAKAPKAKGK